MNIEGYSVSGNKRGTFGMTNYDLRMTNRGVLRFSPQRRQDAKERNHRLIQIIIGKTEGLRDQEKIG
jgi:hypothetical protein